MVINSFIINLFSQRFMKNMKLTNNNNKNSFNA